MIPKKEGVFWTLDHSQNELLRYEFDDIDNQFPEHRIYCQDGSDVLSEHNHPRVTLTLCRKCAEVKLTTLLLAQNKWVAGCLPECTCDDCGISQIKLEEIYKEGK